MPKISVQLEADSPEEFRALLAAFQPSWVVAPVAAVTPGEVEDALADYHSHAAPEAEQPAAEAKEPAQPRRGRPRKEKPAPADEAPVEQAVAEQEAQPEPVKAEPVKAKPKAMPHAQPENGAATRQDLLDAFSEYVQRYGASFGFSDISSLLQKNLGDGVRKASDVPEAQLQVAIGAIKTAIADNPFNRKRDYA